MMTIRFSAKGAPPSRLHANRLVKDGTAHGARKENLRECPGKRGLMPPVKPRESPTRYCALYPLSKSTRLRYGPSGQAARLWQAMATDLSSVAGRLKFPEI